MIDLYSQSGHRRGAGDGGMRSGEAPGPATPHELSINLIEIEGEIYLWQTEIRTNPPGSKAVSRPDSRVDSRAENKRNLVNRPVKNRARWRPVSEGNEGPGWPGAAPGHPCSRSARAPSSA